MGRKRITSTCVLSNFTLHPHLTVAACRSEVTRGGGEIEYEVAGAAEVLLRADYAS
jgi:hypothetical protein